MIVKSFSEALPNAEMSRIVTHSDQPQPADVNPPASPEPPANASGQRVIDAGELLAGEQEVIIRNGDQFYRLRRTRQGKLILHK